MSINDKYIAATQQISEMSKEILSLKAQIFEQQKTIQCWTEWYQAMKQERNELREKLNDLRGIV